MRFCAACRKWVTHKNLSPALSLARLLSSLFSLTLTLEYTNSPYNRERERRGDERPTDRTRRARDTRDREAEAQTENETKSDRQRDTQKHRHMDTRRQRQSERVSNRILSLSRNTLFFACARLRMGWWWQRWMSYWLQRGVACE